MTREQIENAAVTMKESQNYHMSFEDAQDYINKCGFDIPWNDGDVFVDEREITRTIGNVLKWRINSVWHDLPNDLPQKENTWILLELIFEGRLVYLPVEWVNDGDGAPKQAIRWAYIDDLLPERKEVTNGGR